MSSNTNHYSGPCRFCGSWVAPDEGVLEKSGSGWSVRHRACQAGSRPLVPDGGNPKQGRCVLCGFLCQPGQGSLVGTEIKCLNTKKCAESVAQQNEWRRTRGR